MGRVGELERKLRRKLFFVCFWTFTISLSIFLFWKLNALLLPILVGGILAYLFRPIKERVQISWLPHEARILGVFAVTFVVLFFAFNKVRQLIPDDRQKLELKVRLKYKMNEKYADAMDLKNPEKRPNPLIAVFANEIAPMMDHVNDLLSLTPEEQDQFEKYRKGYKGQTPVSDKYYQYFVANLVRSPYVKVTRDPSSEGGAVLKTAESNEVKEHAKKGLLDALSIWILAPLIFIFMVFDNGQIRRYIIGLVPNRYFELSLTVLDMLDDAVGKYLRGTLMQCTLVGITLTVGLFLLGMPISVSITIGAISGLINAIPFLGPTIGLVIALAYALIAENIDPLIPGLVADDLALYVVVLSGVSHLLDNVVYQPIVLGGAVNLHPLVVIVAIIAGSLMMGVWGMLLAIPAIVVLKTAVETLIKELKAYRII